MEQDTDSTEESAPQRTLIDEMTAADWVEARRLAERFDAELGAR